VKPKLGQGDFISGNTPLLKIGKFCDEFDLPNLLVKDESKNPFGTWKDRRSQTIVEKAKQALANKLCIITFGNAGYSLAKFCDKTDIKVVSIIDVSLPMPIKIVLRRACYKVIETDLSEKILTPNDSIALARENDKETVWDVTNGFQDAYESIIEEIKETVPDYLICPVGSGEGFVGLYNGLRKANLHSKLIGVKPYTNPSCADKLNTPWTPYEAKIRKILTEGHGLITLNEKDIKSVYSFSKNLIDCEPSSSVTFGVLTKLKIKPSAKVIVINSGKGLE